MRNRYFHFRDSEDISFLKGKAFGIDYKGDKLYWTGESVILSLVPIDRNNDESYTLEIFIEESPSGKNQFTPSASIEGNDYGFGNTDFDRKFIDWLYNNGYVEGDDDPHFTDKARHLPDYWDI